MVRGRRYPRSHRRPSALEVSERMDLDARIEQALSLMHQNEEQRLERILANRELTLEGRRRLSVAGGLAASPVEPPEPPPDAPLSERLKYEVRRGA